MVLLKVSSESEFEPAFESAVRQRVDALLVGADPFFTSRRAQLVALAARHAMPAAYPWREYAIAGGLMSYGYQYRRGVPSDWPVCRAHPQGRQARRPSSATAHQVRADDQPQNREVARSQRTTHFVRVRRRADSSPRYDGVDPPPADGRGPNAQAVLMKATFWIETVIYRINVPPMSAGDAPLALSPGADQSASSFGAELPSLDSIHRGQDSLPAAPSPCPQPKFSTRRKSS